MMTHTYPAMGGPVHPDAQGVIAAKVNLAVTEVTVNIDSTHSNRTMFSYGLGVFSFNFIQIYALDIEEWTSFSCTLRNPSADKRSAAYKSIPFFKDRSWWTF